MKRIEQIKKRLPALVCGPTARAPDMASMSLDLNNSYQVDDAGMLNLLSRQGDGFNINHEGLQVSNLASARADRGDGDEGGGGPESTYRCASSEMCVFGTIGFGASSIVRKAIHIPTHRILALKKINVFEKDKRQQLLNEIKTLCEAPKARGLVEFYGAFFQPDSGQISIALEYMDGGSLADIVRVKKRIPEPVLSAITRRVLQGLVMMHTKRHLVHRDIKPANLLMNLNGDPKITDFGISAGLDNSIAMCATFVGTVTYMSPERINAQFYSFPADVWSLGITILECGTGTFPYNASTGPVNLMLQVMDDPSPTPPPGFSPEFCSFVADCLHKDSAQRPQAEQLLNHPFITKYANADVDLSSFVHSVFDATERLKDLSDMLTVHYYMLFDGPEELWEHMETFYTASSSLAFGDHVYNGAPAIFRTLTTIRSMLRRGEVPGEKLVHTVDNLECCAYGRRGVMVRVSGSLVIGTRFVPPGDSMQVEGLPAIEARGPRLGSFSEQFVMEPGELSGSFWISKQEIHIQR